MLDLSALLTRKLPLFLSYFNEISGGCENCAIFRVILEQLEALQNDAFDCMVMWMEGSNIIVNGIGVKGISR